jgi:hypothetical protein
MRFAITSLIVAALSGALTIESAYAQSAASPGGGGGGHKQKQQTSDKTDKNKPKADDKAYNAALKSLPDKPYDPWAGAR